MSLSLLLTADVHLGMKFAGYPDMREELTEARFATLERVVALAGERGCDMLVVAGDLFDRLTVPDRDIIRAARIIDGFQGRLAAVLPGNHDYIAPGGTGLWTKFAAHAGDRTIVLGECASYPLAHFDIDAVLHAAPCDAKTSATNRIGWMRDLVPDGGARHHIGVAHGSLEGVSPDMTNSYYPMTLEELARPGLDLWLCGHTDRMQYPPRAGAFDRVFYPGTPEPNGFNCRHAGLAWIIMLDDDNRVEAESLQTGTYAFTEMRATLASPDDVDALVARFADGDMRRTLVKLVLDGRLAENIPATIAAAHDRIRAHVASLDIDATALLPEVNMDLIDREFTPGSFPHRLLTSFGDDDLDRAALRIAYDLVSEVRS